MEEMKISSSLYDYSVSFINDFSEQILSFSEKCVFVIDKNVFELYKSSFSVVDKSKCFFLEPVESKKNIYTVIEIIEFWKSLGVQKNWKVVCIGGGITQDLTTMASNLYLRNVDWYFFPTTLLSMCDSCIGGKCGINLNEFKNQLGVFYPPKKIFIDTKFLNTLSVADYINGWGEILKFSLTLDPEFYEDLKKLEQYVPCSDIDSYIYRGLKVKKLVIEQDEFDSDYRRVLNYGHSFGHALETYTNNVIPHGQGVIWGIDVANYIAYKKGLITNDIYLDIKSVVKKFLNKEFVIENPEKLFSILKSDKKVKDGVLYFALLNSDKKLIVYPVNLDESLFVIFKDYLNETHEYYNC